MEKKTRIIITIIIFVLAIAATAFISAYITKNGVYLVDKKKVLTGSYSYSRGASDNPNDLVYIALESDNKNETKEFVEYKISDETNYQKGTCEAAIDDCYVTLFDGDGKIYAYVVYIDDGYMLFSGNGAEHLTKISEGAVLPSGYTSGQ